MHALVENDTSSALICTEASVAVLPRTPSDHRTAVAATATATTKRMQMVLVDDCNSSSTLWTRNVLVGFDAPLSSAEIFREPAESRCPDSWLVTEGATGLAALCASSETWPYEFSSMSQAVVQSIKTYTFDITACNLLNFVRALHTSGIIHSLLGVIVFIAGCVFILTHSGLHSLLRGLLA